MDLLTARHKQKGVYRIFNATDAEEPVGQGCSIDGELSICLLASSKRGGRTAVRLR